MIQRNVFGFVLDIDEHAVTLIEGAALTILPTQANGNALLNERAKGHGFSHSVVEGTLPTSHFGTLLEEFFYLWMDVEFFWVTGKLV